VSAPEDTVLAYWREHREQLRQSENQRALLTNYVLVIAAAINGFIGLRGAIGQRDHLPAVRGPMQRDRSGRLATGR
jgi:hypothetical protein